MSYKTNISSAKADLFSTSSKSAPSIGSSSRARVSKPPASSVKGSQSESVTSSGYNYQYQDLAGKKRAKKSFLTEAQMVKKGKEAIGEYWIVMLIDADRC